MHITTRRIARHHTTSSEFDARQIANTGDLGYGVPCGANAVAISNIGDLASNIMNGIPHGVPRFFNTISCGLEPVLNGTNAVPHPVEGWLHEVIDDIRDEI